MDINSNIDTSFDNFEQGDDISSSKPLAIIDINCIIRYCNSTFHNIFLLSVGDEINKLQAELQLIHLVDGFAKSKYNSFNFDLVLSEENNFSDKTYKVEVERALIENQTYFILIFNSVEDQKRIEERIYLLINAIEYGNVAIIITDKSGFIKYNSKSSEEILLSNVEQLYNSYLPDALTGLVDPKDIFTLKEALQNSAEWQCLSSVKNSKDELIYRKLKLSPVQKQFDIVTNFILTFNDVTDHIKSEEKLRKAFEKENQLNRLKSAFLSNMSHEIRTPSTAIIGFANILREDIKAGNYDNVLELVEFLDEGINRMVRLFENIIELSLLESGDFLIDSKIEDLRELLRRSFDNFHNLAQNKKIDFKLELTKMPVYIEVDKMKFNKVIESLIDNAIKYNKRDGSVTVSSQVSKESVNVIIADTGRGIEKNKIEAILQPFIQEEFEGHKREFEGAGLGLTIAYKLTKALKGEFNIMSRKGQGTSVFLQFPLAKAK
jgi:signal transduction histidine kinase